MIDDDLSWLIYPGVNDMLVNNMPVMIDKLDSKEQVEETTDDVTEDIISSFQIPVTLVEHPNPNVEVVVPKEVISEPVVIMDNSDSAVDVTTSDRYKLPPRSTRGFSPRRYDPDLEAQRSRYPVNKESDIVLSQTARAFNASLYSNSLHKNVEEDFKDPRWKKAMEEEITALEKSETWENVKSPTGRKWWDADGYTLSNTMLMEQLNDTKLDL